MVPRLFQRCELEAYLGDFVNNYDIDGIISEATEIDADDNRVWVDLDLNEFLQIIERHETK